jgi:hypothetical protein
VFVSRRGAAQRWDDAESKVRVAREEKT